MSVFLSQRAALVKTYLYDISGLTNPSRLLYPLHEDGKKTGETDQEMTNTAKRAFRAKPFFAAQLIAVLFFSFLFLFQTSALHHHSDGLAHADCPYCAFSSLPAMHAADGNQAPPVLCATLLKSLQQTLRLTPFYGSCHVIRAPPVIS
jgi:hypothetical protein